MTKANLRETLGITIIATIIIVMAAIPQIGYIRIPIFAFDLTLLFIPVLVGSTLFGKRGALILGLVFGLSSFAVAIFRPASPFDLAFRNPLVSVLPRVLFPMVYLFILDIAKKFNTFKLSIFVTIILLLTLITFIATDMSIGFVLFIFILMLANIGFIVYCKKHPTKKLLYIVPTFLSVIFHGLIVLSMLALFYSQALTENFPTQHLAYVVVTILMTNSTLEAVFSSLIMQLIMPGIKRSRNE